MKKVINITLGGIVFAIEQDAYETLAVYIDGIKNNLTQNDDAKEIIDDIESAIAEKFVARGRSEKLAVTSPDVESVIAEMGTPSEFTENTEEEALQTDELKKRLYRDPEDAIIAGVASGLAQYFDIDPVIVRLIFVVSVFFNGLGVLAYLILWLVVPKAETTADRYAMRGERVTLKEISERVKKNIESIEKADYTASKKLWITVRRVLNKVFQLLGIVAKYIGVFIRYVAGVICVIGGALGIAGMISVYGIVLLSERVFFPHEVQIAVDTLQGNALGIVAMASSFVMMGILLLAIIMLGASLLAKRNLFTLPKTITLIVVWIIALVLAGTTSVLQVEQVAKKIDGDREMSQVEVRG